MTTEPAGSAEKLVRDCYDWLPHRVAGPGEKYGLLAAKLDEEVAEVKAAAIGSAEFVEELADLVEVCYSLGGWMAVEQMRLDKRTAKGGFDKLLVMNLADITGRPALSTEADSRPTPESDEEDNEARDAGDTRLPAATYCRSCESGRAATMRHVSDCPCPSCDTRQGRAFTRRFKRLLDGSLSFRRFDAIVERAEQISAASLVGCPPTPEGPEHD